MPRPAPLSTATLPARLAQLAREPGDGVVPGDLAEPAVDAPQHWGLDPAGIVQPLQRCLPAGAELALIDGMLGIALELDGAAFARPHVQAASGRALGAGAGVPGGDAGDLILRLHQVRHQLLDPAG